MAELIDHHCPDATCPTCGHHVNGALGMTGTEPPAPGDISVCIKCASIAIYADTLALRLPSESDWEDTPPQILADLRRAQEMVMSLPND